MAKYFALHTLKKSAAEFTPFWNEYVPAVGRIYAEAAAKGQPPPSPAACAKTWNAVTHGRDYMFCIWEADKPEDIKLALQPLDAWVTTDLFPVDEVDWGEVVAKAAQALEAEKVRA